MYYFPIGRRIIVCCISQATDEDRDERNLVWMREQSVLENIVHFQLHGDIFVAVKVQYVQEDQQGALELFYQSQFPHL